MSDKAAIDPAVWRVIEDFEVRARRDDELWRSLPEEQLRARLDEFLLPVGRAAATLMNLIIKEGEGHYPLAPKELHPVVDFIIKRAAAGSSSNE